MTSDLAPATAPDTEPKGPSNLRLRIIWGLIAAAGLFGCTFASPLTFGLFFAAVQAIMLKEFYRIMRAKGYQPAFWIGLLSGLVLFALVHLWLGGAQYLHATANNTYFEIAGASVPIGAGALPEQQLVLTAWALSAICLLVLLLIVALLLREMRLWPKHDNPFGNVAVTFGGLLYVSVPMALLQLLAFVQLYPQDLRHYDPRRVFFLIFLIWASDTGAYIAGKTMGKHKLAPAISPGKTWEGFLGGALLTLAVGWAAGYFVPDISLAHRLVAATVVAIFGPLGDLAESMLKRSAGVKDSGTFLPGHGGLLDRFDAFLLVLPVLALLQALAG